jgi:hypothetical protein
MSWIWENAERVGALLTAVAAVAALIYAHLQISEGRRAERQANAHELWRDYLKLAFDHPKLADPRLQLAKFDYDNLTVDGSAKLFQKYEWFAGGLLDAFVEILDVIPSKEWQMTIKSQLQLHRDYLLSSHFRNSEFSQQYSPKFQAFVADALQTSRKLAVPGAGTRMKSSARKSGTHA